MEGYVGQLNDGPVWQDKAIAGQRIGVYPMGLAEYLVDFITDLDPSGDYHRFQV
jgi:hypothetical protein